MLLPARALVPLPALVDDWVDQQCQERGITFDDLAVEEALEALRVSLDADCASSTPDDVDLATWLQAAVTAYGTGPENGITEALCALCEADTGADLFTMHDSGWRRVPAPLTSRGGRLREKPRGRETCRGRMSADDEPLRPFV